MLMDTLDIQKKIYEKIKVNIFILNYYLPDIFTLLSSEVCNIFIFAFEMECYSYVMKVEM